MRQAIYNKIGKSYSEYRAPDPHIAGIINQSLGNAKRIINVGAGSGSYEPGHLNVTAVEPSSVMISQRPAHAAEAVQGRAEHLPFKDKTFDAAMAILTIHHWEDLDQGLSELKRVAKKVIIVTWDPSFEGFWMTNDYFPEILSYDKGRFPAFGRIANLMGAIKITNIPVPANCIDGFASAYWQRQEAILMKPVRDATSAFNKIPDLNQKLARLKQDISSGIWAEKYGYLLNKNEMDLGFRLLEVSLD